MIYAKKSLGQNFLKSEKALSQIIEAGSIVEGDTILEIGPGEGALTEKILAKNPQALILVEKDDRLIPILEEKFKASTANKETKSGRTRTRISIIHGDIIDLLKDDESKTLAEAGLKSGYKIIANIPYYITGLIVRNIFEQESLPEKIVLLVQKEVAERMEARDKKESLLSLSVKLYGTPKKIASVPRGAFVPAPNVDSAIILIDKISRKISSEEEGRYFETIKAAFAHKRKLLASNLLAVSTKESVTETLESLRISKNIRAEDLSANDYVNIAKGLVFKKNAN